MLGTLFAVTAFVSLAIMIAAAFVEDRSCDEFTIIVAGLVAKTWLFMLSLFALLITGEGDIFSCRTYHEAVCD